MRDILSSEEKSVKSIILMLEASCMCMYMCVCIYIFIYIYLPYPWSFCSAGFLLVEPHLVPMGGEIEGLGDPRIYP